MQDLSKICNFLNSILFGVGSLIKIVINLLSLRGADGVNIDFEFVQSKNKQQFTNFIKNISTRRKTNNPHTQISLCLYAVDYHEVFNISSINSFVDIYTLMGYDYYGSFSSHAELFSP